MIIEKFRWFENSTIINEDIGDFATWHTLTYGDLGRPRGTGWLEVLKERKAIFVKNQGLANDNSSACQIEIYFGPYTIQHLEPATSAITYNVGTNRFSLNFAGTIVPVSNQTYLELKPFTTHQYPTFQDLDAVLSNVANVAGNVYTFQILDTQVRDMLKNGLTSGKQATYFSCNFYNRLIPALTTERGIILNVRDEYWSWITWDQVLYYRAVASTSVGATIVIQQFS